MAIADFPLFSEEHRKLSFALGQFRWHSEVHAVPWSIMSRYPRSGETIETREITIRVDVQAAWAYTAASAEERRKIDLLLGLRLGEVTSQASSSSRAWHAVATTYPLASLGPSKTNRGGP